MKHLLAVAASLMLAFVFAGCSASGPFQSHSAFKQAVLPSGYQSFQQNQVGYGAQDPFQSRNGNPAYGFGATPQPNYGFRGQAAFPQNNQGVGGGLLSPFVGRNYTSGSC